MKKILLGLVCVVAVLTSFRIVRQSLTGIPRDAPLIGTDTAPPAEEKARLVPPGPEDLGPKPKAWHWQEIAVHATNFGKVANDALPAANSGNSDAQFALYALFQYCRDGMRQRTPEQRSRIPEPIFREMHARCDGLAAQFPDLAGEADRWLHKALEAKFPRALAFAAYEDLNAMARKPPKKEERQRRIYAARSNILQALNSNDPAITFEVATVLWQFFPDDPRVEQAKWVWRLAGCEQGLECGSKEMFVLDDCRRRNMCMNDETTAQYILRVGDFPSLDARAHNLARTLRKGELDDRTFEETVTSIPPPSRKRDVPSTPARILP